MKWQKILPLILVLALARTTFAGLIFGTKKPVKPPNERVVELIATLKGDGDENKRYDAAEELRHFDPVQFPQIVPALIEALFNDAKPSVRSEAAQTLGKLRPINQTVGQALEQAHDKDPSMRVRLQAGSSLMSYRWQNYKGVKPPVVESKEPPTNDPKKTAQPTPIKIVPAPQPTANNPPPVPATPQPKRWWWFGSTPKPTPAPSNPSGPRTMPVGPKTPPVQSAEPPLAPPMGPTLDTIPVPSIPSAGNPTLAPPKLEPIPQTVPSPPEIVPPPMIKPFQSPVQDTGPDLPPQG